MLLIGLTVSVSAADRITVRSRYAEVAGDASARELAARVAALVDDAVPHIAPLVGTQDLRPVRATIYRDRRQFTLAAGIPPRAAVVGLASFPSQVIHIDGTGLLASIERIVPHEIAHVLIARAMSDSLAALPAWVNEGIAEYAAGERASRVDPVTLSAIGRGESIPLAQLDSAFGDKGKTPGLAYTEAASIVNYLVASRGPEAIAKLLAATRQQGDFGSALSQVTGMNMAQLESSWRRSVSRRWRWALLFQSQALILGLMLVLFIAGYIRYRRERRRRQEMADADW